LFTGDNMPTQKLTHDIITAAIEGFEAQKRKIDGQIGELRAMLSGGRSETRTAPKVQPKRKRKMSAAGRRAIGEAAKKRWAAFHAAKETADKPTVSTKAAPKKSTGKGIVAKKAAVKKVAMKAPARTPKKSASVKKAAVKKAAAKTTIPEPAETSTETAAQ
jgi:hypothetical protein